jgi:TolB-like protein/lipopolysaccharide biosynthesis regulator YciM
VGTQQENIVIAVLPFEYLGQNDALAIFSRAFSSDLVAELSQFKQFHIRYFESNPNNPPSADHLSKCDYVIKGTFSEISDEIKVNVHLVRQADDRIVWSFRNKNKITSIQHIQQEMLGNMVASLQHQMNLDLLLNLRRKQMTNFKAYECWLYGVDELKKGSAQSDEAAREYFSKALSIDPDFSLAYSGMSLSYFNEWSCRIWDRWDLSQRGAKEWAQKALEMDPENYMANMILGRVLLFEQLFDECEIYLEKSLRLNSNDPFCLIQIASAFLYLDRLDEAEELYQKALFLDPEREERYHPTGAYIYFEKKEFEKCIEIGERYLKDSWVDYPAIIAAAYCYLGNMEKAMTRWNMYLSNFSDRISRDKENLESEALKWIVNINPYKNKTVFKEFWEVVSQKKQVKIEIAQPEVSANFFLREGEIWRIQYLGKLVHVAHSKGMADLARLINQEGEEVSVEELTGSKVEQLSVDLADRTSLLHVKDRLEQIESQLVEAPEDEDEKLEELKNEYDQLTRYITSSVDKRGRIRMKGSTSEKARSAVTQRIKSAIKKFEQIHPELYRHLSSSIKTGVYCSYKPHQCPDWQL